MNITADYCMICMKDGVSVEDVASEIHVAEIAIEEFKLCKSCKHKVERALNYIRKYLVSDAENAPKLSNRDKRMLRIGLAHRTKVRDLKSAERRRFYFK